MVFINSVKKLSAFTTAFFLIMIIYLIFITSSIGDKEKVIIPLPHTKQNTHHPFNTDLIQYVYHQSDDDDINFRFFLKHALHNKADFVFVINGYSSLVDEIPEGPNIKVFIRENACFDIGAHGETLSNQLQRKYSRVILMNSSVRGPFLPKRANNRWSDLFFDKLNDEVKIVGTTASCDIIPHLQSMILAFDRLSIQLVLPLMQTCFTDKQDAINTEVQLTSAVLDAGYKAATLISNPWDSEHCSNPDTHDSNFLIDMTG